MVCFVKTCSFLVSRQNPMVWQFLKVKGLIQAWHFAFSTLCYYSKEENHLFLMHQWGIKMWEADGKIILFFISLFIFKTLVDFLSCWGGGSKVLYSKMWNCLEAKVLCCAIVSHLISMTKVNVTMLKGAIFIWKLFDSHNKGIQRCIRPACLINNFTANPDKKKIQYY